MSRFGGHWQGGPNQQSWTSDDGDTHVSYSSSSYSWSSSSPGGSQAQNNASAFQQLPPITGPQMLPMPDFNQIHQQHVDLHRSTMQSGMQMQQNMMQNMMQPLQIQQPPPLMPAYSQAQMQYASSSQARLPPPNRQPLQIRDADEDSSDEDEYNTRIVTRDRRTAHRREEVRAAERDRDTRAAERDRQMLGVAQTIEDRIQRNDVRMQEQAEAQAKQEAARHAQQDEAAREQREMMQQLKNQVAKLQTQVSKPQPAAPAFDMSALQKMISEGRTEQISKADIKALIDDAVGKQLSGVAKSADLESAAARMERNLHKVSGASDAQVAQQVQRELTSAINQVGRYVDARQKRIEDSYQSSTTSQPAAMPRVRTEFTVEELSNDDQPKTNHRSSSSHDKTKSLPAPSSGSRDVRSEAGGSQKKASVLQPPRDQPSRSSTMSTLSIPPTANDAMAMLTTESLREVDAKPSRSSKLSTMSVQPSGANAMVRSNAAPAPVPEARSSSGSNNAPKMSTMSVQPSDANALVRPKSEHKGSTISSDEAQQLVASTPVPMPRDTTAPSRDSKRSTMSVQPSDMNALTKPKPAEGAATLSSGQARQIADRPPNSSSAKMPTMSVQPSDVNALVRPKSGSTSAKMSTMSVQPSNSNSLIRTGAADVSKSESSESKEVRDSRAAKKSTTSVQPSDCSSLVRSQRSGGQQDSSSAPKKSSKGSRIQAINDRRGEARPSPLRQIENVQPDDGMSQALVRQSKDMVKK